MRSARGEADREIREILSCAGPIPIIGGTQWCNWGQLPRRGGEGKQRQKNRDRFFLWAHKFPYGNRMGVSVPFHGLRRGSSGEGLSRKLDDWQEMWHNITGCWEREWGDGLHPLETGEVYAAHFGLSRAVARFREIYYNYYGALGGRGAGNRMVAFSLPGLAGSPGR